jgi:hypothetical protein
MRWPTNSATPVWSSAQLQAIAGHDDGVVEETFMIVSARICGRNFLLASLICRSPNSPKFPRVVPGVAGRSRMAADPPEQEARTVQPARAKVGRKPPRRGTAPSRVVANHNRVRGPLPIPTDQHHTPARRPDHPVHPGRPVL